MLRLQKAPFGKTTSLQYSWRHDGPYDHSRNVAAKECLESGAEWLFFIDSDVLVPQHTLERLLMHRLPIVGGLYYRRHPNTHAEVFRFAPGSTQLDPIPDYSLQPGLNEVDGIGCGCLLIHRRVFEALIPRVKKLTIPSGGTNFEMYEFFKYSIAEPPFTSEDLTFCILAREAGFKIYCDTTISCGHILSTMQLKDGRPQWTPLELGHD